VNESAAKPTPQTEIELLATRMAAVEKILFEARRPPPRALSELREDVLAARQRTQDTRLLAELDRQLDVLRVLVEIALERETAEAGIAALRLTAVTLILVVATLITGWYGMNLALPAFGHDLGSVWALSLIVILCTATIIWLRRRRWL
jgi:Mg2+ and Co2+ transporter CorA